MPLNTPYRLRLSKLGHIAAGINSGQVRLAADCRGSAAKTDMWDDFKAGTISFSENTYTQAAGSSEDCYLIISVPSSGGVGSYMGATSGGTDYYVSKRYTTLRAGDTIDIDIDNSSPGGLYVDRIQNREANKGDYVLSQSHVSGSHVDMVALSEQRNSEMDRFNIPKLD